MHPVASVYQRNALRSENGIYKSRQSSDSVLPDGAALPGNILSASCNSFLHRTLTAHRRSGLSREKDMLPSGGPANGTCVAWLGLALAATASSLVIQLSCIDPIEIEAVMDHWNVRSRQALAGIFSRCYCCAASQPVVDSRDSLYQPYARHTGCDARRTAGRCCCAAAGQVRRS